MSTDRNPRVLLNRDKVLVRIKDSNKKLALILQASSSGGCTPVESPSLEEDYLKFRRGSRTNTLNESGEELIYVKLPKCKLVPIPESIITERKKLL